LYKTITFELKAHHRLISNRLTQEENERIYQKCMGKHGHGHNYKICVTFCLSPEDFSNGRLTLFTSQVHSLLIEPFHLKSLNVEFAAMGVENPVTTGEQIVSIFSEKLRLAGLSEFVSRLEVQETRKNSFITTPKKPIA
jgi:6-pyruvoyltetrahydropterin/6-carboxytetrahydropterin synthase